MTLLCLCRAESSEEVIMLDTTDINRIEIPKSPVINFIHENDKNIYNKNTEEDINNFLEEETDNKLLRSFYKFVDDKAVNNKANQFTSSMLDEVDESDYSY